MTWTQISGTISALPARRGDEPGDVPVDRRRRARRARSSPSCSCRRWRPTSLDCALGVAIGSIAQPRRRPQRARCGSSSAASRDGRGVVSGPGSGLDADIVFALSRHPPEGGFCRHCGSELAGRRRLGDHAARRRGDRHARRPLQSMRILTAAAMMAVLVAAVSCEGQSASTAPQACSGLRRPGVPLAFMPARRAVGRPGALHRRPVRGCRRPAGVGDAAEDHAPRQRQPAWRGSSGRCCTRATAAAWPGSGSPGCALTTRRGSCTRPRAPRSTRTSIPAGCSSTSPIPSTRTRGAARAQEPRRRRLDRGRDDRRRQRSRLERRADRPGHGRADDGRQPPPLPGPRARADPRRRSRSRATRSWPTTARRPWSASTRSTAQTR